MDRNMPGIGIALKLSENGPSVHDRQLDIKNNGIRQISSCQLQPFVALGCCQSLEPIGIGHINEYLRKIDVILDNEHNFILRGNDTSIIRQYKVGLYLLAHASRNFLFRSLLHQ
ncbi:hypothetical protein D3C81_731430 [compost metagenome]